MSGFSADWLQLREPADAAARNPALTEQLLAWRRQQDALSVLDLGSGTGANPRFLAPRLGGVQHWRLVEHDPALLAQGDALLRRWAAGQALALSWEWQAQDLARERAWQDPSDVQLVTASALLDLVSSAWLDRLARRCRDWRAAVFIVLSYDGSIVWHPVLNGDEAVCARVNRHQRGDKGFGPALGPAAAPTLAVRLERWGYQVELQPSPWRLDAAHGAVQMALLDGWVEAVRQLDPDADDWLAGWALTRRRLIEQGASQLRVGHWDLFARLPM